MKPRVLVVVAPFGFGPAARALMLVEALHADADLVLSADRDAAAFITRHKPDHIVCHAGLFAQRFPDRAALDGYDRIISFNHAPALDHLYRLGLIGRTVFVDSLLVWRQASEKSPLPPGLLAYLVQDNPGTAALLDRAQAQRVVLTAPWVWPLASDRTSARTGAVLHLGGITSPLAPWEQIAGSVRALVQGVIAAVKSRGLALTVLGSAHLAELGLEGDGVSVPGDVSPARSAQLIANAAMLITSPGIGAIVEAMALDTPIILMPPMNSTQIEHYRAWAAGGMPGVLTEAQVARLVGLAATMPWQDQTRLCLDVLRQSAHELTAKLPRLLAAVLDGPHDRVMQGQRAIFGALSTEPPLAVIRQLLLPAGRPQATPSPAPSQAAAPGPAPPPDALVAQLRALPKVELHVHLEGSMPPELLLQLAQRNGLKLPFSDPRQFHLQRPFRSFREFADRLLLAVHCLRQPLDFHDAVIVMGLRLAQQNVVYAEVTWTPQFYLRRGVPLDEILAAMNAARAGIQARTGLEMRWIPDLVRSYPDAAQQVAQWASQAHVQAAGVVALGLGGPEVGHPATPFAPAFAAARAAGLPANPHAGEGAGADSVWQTLEALQPARIGHGVSAIEDPVLVAHLARLQLPLEVCLTSNVRLGLYASHAEHPLRRLVEAGCRVSLNTDDPVLFSTSLAREYLHAIRDCGLDLAFVRRSILDALQSSHLPPADKDRLATLCRQRFAQLDAAAPGTAAPPTADTRSGR